MAINKAFYYPFLAINIAASAFFIKLTAHCSCLNQYIFCDLPSSLDLADPNDKWTVLRYLLVRISLFLLVNIVTVSSLRAITGKRSPASEEDPVIIGVLNRIANNTIEHSFIFFALYSYFLLFRADSDLTLPQALIIASWFFIARVSFLVTYAVGQLIDVPYLRAFGVALNYAIAAILLEACFNKKAVLLGMVLDK